MPATKLQIIGSCRTEPVNIDVQAATEAGIPVVYAPGRNARAVVEFTIGLIIAESRNIARGHLALAQGIWRADLYLYDNAPRELAGQTIGLIGFGHVGSMLPSYLKPFGVRVLAYDPYVHGAVFAERGVERVTDMADLLAESDIVSLHARVTPETIKFIGEKQFRQMKRGAYFVNTARGPMVDYDALYRALTDGHLRGAALETFASEPPPPDWPLLKLPNVTLTPHIAGCSVELGAPRRDHDRTGHCQLLRWPAAQQLREPRDAATKLSCLHLPQAEKVIGNTACPASVRRRARVL